MPIENKQQQARDNGSKTKMQQMISSIAKAHILIDEIAARPEFTDSKGTLVIRLPFNRGGIRGPVVVFEHDVTIRAGLEVVRCERIKI